MQSRPWNPKAPEVPVDKDGNWQSYPYSYGGGSWLSVVPFEADLLVDGMQTGRSSKLVILKNADTGTKYPMFVADMVAGIADGLFEVVSSNEGGMLRGKWTASKRGANYGIKAVK